MRTVLHHSCRLLQKHGYKTPPIRSTNGPLFDSHCHIGLGFSYGPSKKDPTPKDPFWPFADEHGRNTCEEHFVRSLDDGVTKMTLVGIDGTSSLRVKLISEYLNKMALEDSINSSDGNTKQQRPLHVYWTAGLHPSSSHHHEREFPIIADLARKSAAETKLQQSVVSGDGSSLTTAQKLPMSRLVAIGETGMDFFKSKGSVEQQKASLFKHLRLAKELDLPVIIHAREADDELLRAFDDFLGAEGGWGEHGLIKGVMHCFSSDAHRMEQYLKMGFYISFTNNITYKRSVDIQAACSRCPLERIVIETDSPFLPPQRCRGQVNEPANTRDTYEQACKLRGVWGDQQGMATLQEALWRNTHSLFGLSH